jgi:hypothetical protein
MRLGGGGEGSWLHVHLGQKGGGREDLERAGIEKGVEHSAARVHHEAARGVRQVGLCEGTVTPPHGHSACCWLTGR